LSLQHSTELTVISPIALAVDGHEPWYGGLKGNLALYVLASASIAVIFIVHLADSTSGWLGTPFLRALLAGSIVAGIAVHLLRATILRARGRRTQQRHAQAAGDVHRALAAADAFLKTEPHVLVYWEHGQGVRVAAHTLTGLRGIPADATDLLKFGQWLDLGSAKELKASLDLLFDEGRPFTQLLKTRGNENIEVDGRAIASRAILRIRDAAGYKQDLARLLEIHRRLTRDVNASRLLLDALPMPAWFRDETGQIAWANEAYVKAVDALDVKEIRARRLELLEARHRERIDTSMAAGDVFRERMPLISGGERRTHDVVVLPIDGATAGAALDATALEAVRGELNRQTAAYDRTLDRVATAVAIFTPDQRLAFFNEAYRKLWQLDEDWLSSRPVHGEILDRLRALSRLPEVVNYRDWRAKAQAVFTTGAMLEDWWHLLDGRTIHVISEQRPDGGVTFLYDDATQRLAMESRYNAMIDAQRETLDSLKEAVAVFATDGRLKLFNSAMSQIWKLPRATLAEGPHIDEIIQLCSVLFDDGETWPRISRAVCGIAERRQVLDGQLTRPDGSIIDYSISPLPDGATLITFSDVTGTKRYERALIERNEALVASDRLKSQFISHVSYELRTPLTNIIGFSELLSSPRTGDLNGKQREYLGDISASSKSLLAIINDILDLATIDAGSLELNLVPVNARTLIEQTLQAVRDRVERSRIELDVRISAGVADFVADGARVRQMLYNLMSNAIGFSKPGNTVRLGCWLDSGMITFAVEDSGVGIPRDQQARVFERFESRSYGSKHRGAGLGLAVVKSLVELHGGNMVLESEPGIGTRVTIRLPEKGLQGTGGAIETKQSRVA
jgi:signal transduction histidine kinase